MIVQDPHLTHTTSLNLQEGVPVQGLTSSSHNSGNLAVRFCFQRGVSHLLDQVVNEGDSPIVDA